MNLVTRRLDSEPHRSSRQRRRPATVAIVIVIVLLTAACRTNVSPTTSPTAAVILPPASSAPATGDVSQGLATPSVRPVPTIEQPSVPADVSVAPDEARVDLTMPTFSNPIQITNPLFPVSRQASVLMLGRVDDKPFRTEVTLLPFTRIVDWEGQQVETAVSQYQAYLAGRITEIAYDLYAQADDGSVWYFGEDVADFEDGAIVTKEGTWLAGKDAPAAMIMPAQPQVGDVFRTENSPGFAFEEVTVKAIDQTLDGPLGKVPGGLVVSELHMDGATEDKTFAPGYGEFLTTGDGDVEALALAVPTDMAEGSTPVELTSLQRGADAIFAAAGSKDWTAAAAAVEESKREWEVYRANGVPTLIEPRMVATLDELGRAVKERDARRSRQAAIDVARSSLDLQLRYRPVADIDLARFDLWAAQVLVDVAARDWGAVDGDAFTLVYIRDRILERLSSADLGHLNTQLLALQIAAIDEDVAATTSAASELRKIAGTQP